MPQDDENIESDTQTASDSSDNKESSQSVGVSPDNQEKESSSESVEKNEVSASSELSGNDEVEASDGGTESSGQSVADPVEEKEAPPEAPASQAPSPTPSAPPEPKTIIKGVIKKVEKQITQEDKDKIFHDRLAELSKLGVQARHEKHNESLEKITAYLKSNGYITNDEVEKLCNVSDSTAARYLGELEEKGDIIQLGVTGRRVRYRLKQAI